MNGQDIIQDAETDRKAYDYQEPHVSRIALIEHSKLLELHARALAYHCECLGMNAENSFAVCLGKQPPYGDDSYLTTMKKWGLINEKGDPEI
jgi:hypothetical protein